MEADKPGSGQGIIDADDETVYDRDPRRALYDIVRDVTKLGFACEYDEGSPYIHFSIRGNTGELSEEEAQRKFEKAIKLVEEKDFNVYMRRASSAEDDFEVTIYSFFIQGGKNDAVVIKLATDTSLSAAEVLDEGVSAQEDPGVAGIRRLRMYDGASCFGRRRKNPWLKGL